ncbi:MAG TPA: hypothetical protein VEA80_05005 [Vitreimonas sp.]|uniref:hypothetical protein n=1 Tax=Vitreimonas sp. TaxID=3069702 RepID=UPI002D6A6DDE|nr:hypothetical protein [Vitreimonas sp.]HYD86811.1 hypothetical protein [Vitreimonas sp.]
MRRLLCWIIAALALAETAAAQAPNPVLEHYRAYRVALETGDLVAAEAAAERAYAASQQRDGEGGRTGVLALNLAAMRLLRENPDGARAPAALALRLAANPEAAVDPITAALVLGRAEIGAGAEERQLQSAGARRIRDLLSAAAERPELNGETYPAAVALGAWSFANDRFGDAAEAWTVAEHTSDGANADPQFARAYANIGITASLVMDAAGRLMRPREVERAATAISAAIRAYAPHVSEGSHETLGPVHSAYAQALAWRAALSAKLRSDEMDIPDEIEGVPAREIGAPADARPPCHMRLAEQPRIRYPQRMQNQSGIGSVILHIRTDETGRVVTRRVAAAVGASFAQTVDDLESDWIMERGENSLPGCRAAVSIYQSVVFVIR